MAYSASIVDAMLVLMQAIPRLMQAIIQGLRPKLAQDVIIFLVDTSNTGRRTGLLLAAGVSDLLPGVMHTAPLWTNDVAVRHRRHDSGNVQTYPATGDVSSTWPKPR